MIPDLGTYSGPVLWSYAVSILLLTALVVLSWRRAVKMKSDLQEIENKGKKDG